MISLLPIRKETLAPVRLKLLDREKASMPTSFARVYSRKEPP